MNNSHNSIHAMQGRHSLTQIPTDIEYYPIEHVVNLLRVIAAERDELFLALQNEQAKAATAAAAAAAVVYPAAQAHAHAHAQGHSHGHDTFAFPFPDATEPTPLHNNTNNNTHPQQQQAPPPPPPPPPDSDNADSNNNNDTVPSTFKVDAIKKRIAKKSYMLIKKTPHNKAKKPFTEINEAVPNEASAMALFEGFPPKSDTNRLTKWELTGDQVIQWLHNNNNNNTNNTHCNHKYIHPVKFDGKVIAFGGSKPFIYAWAAYESLQAKFDKKGASMHLKFRTKMVGSGRPEDGANGPPSFL